MRQGLALLAAVALSAVAGTAGEAREDPDARPGKRQVVGLGGVVSKDTTVGGPDVLLHVRKPIVVPDKIALTIRPDSILEFDPGAGLTVSGTLSAAGTQDEPIIFTASDSRRAWVGIVVSNGSLEMSWCVVTRAKTGLDANGPPTVRNAAFVRNVIGMRLNGRGVFEGVAVLDSVRTGVVGVEGSRGPDTFNRVTIAGSGEIGYHGTHKGFPKMKSCIITANRGGGFKGDNMCARGSPELTSCNVYGNGQFDIWLHRGDSYRFTGVYVGKQSSERLAKDPGAVVPNIRDVKRTKKKDAGIVVIDQVPTEPLPGIGAPRAVMELAAKYRPGGKS